MRDHLKRKAVKYKSDELWESYKQIRNSATELIRSSREKNTMKIALKKTIAIPKVCGRCFRKLTDGESKVVPQTNKQTAIDGVGIVFEFYIARL